MLNEVQSAAVTAPLENHLILAGAGSGKTLVLVHRIAWLIQEMHVPPHAILAVTFTNKAANEMRKRVDKILGFSTNHLWLGTFHSLAHRLLRLHAKDANLDENFQIIDTDDQKRMISGIIKQFNLDEDKWPARQIQHFINSKKDEGLRPAHLQDYGDPYLQTLIKVYVAYEEACQRSNLVDFAELLLRAHELWQKNPALLQHYQTRFRYILVDEFQDTNMIQYAWLKLLRGDAGVITAVGDDDQAIYGWRGARVDNIHRFSQDMSPCHVIRLEQNYRSTATILKAANALIANNAERLGKELWTSGPDGEVISLFGAFDELEEARFIAKQIQAADISRDQIAVLYRSNAQSRVLEEALLERGIAYRIYGGLRFFERGEIKDALAYLRIIANRNDDNAFERIINLPTRGIGDKTVEEIRVHARQQNISFWHSMQTLLENTHFKGRASNALMGFIELIDGLEAEVRSLNLADQAKTIIEKSGLFQYYSENRAEKSQIKLENLEELVSAAKTFSDLNQAEQASLLVSFLSHACLDTGDTEEHEGGEVQLMTLHSAKGLEFSLVFLAGLEEGLFPHSMSFKENRLEEERRLFYVGMTRAKEKLFLTYAQIRRKHGREEFHTPSRFIQEIPKNLLHPINPSAKQVEAFHHDDTISETGFALGQRVKHPRYGEGTLMNYEGSGPQTRVQVNFPSEGPKWFLLSYAKLEPVDC